MATTTNENSETDMQNGSDVAENGMLINFEKLTF
jgi:hypothetical protein